MIYFYNDLVVSPLAIGREKPFFIYLGYSNRIPPEDKRAKEKFPQIPPNIVLIHE
jgi:hypothetical protein